MTAAENRLDALVSVVLPVRDAHAQIDGVVRELQAVLACEVTDYEIVVVDNRSEDDTLSRLEHLSRSLPNLQVYCLSARVQDDVARIAGVQQAIGDYVVLMDLDDDAGQIPALLARGVAGHDLVLAVRADARRRRRGLTRLAARAFLRLYKSLSGYDLDTEAPRFRLMSRRLVNYLLQHEDAHLTYPVLPLLGGFSSARFVYEPSSCGRDRAGRSFRDAVDHAIALVMYTSAAPLRLVTLTCAAAALMSVLYCVYVVVVLLVREQVAEGWTTLSLLLSLQFFLIALAIGLLAEYMVHLLRQTTKRPLFYIAREFRSGHLTREQQLNVRQE